MYTYFLCDDYDTIYKFKFSIKDEDKKYYLSLLENYLNEFVFIEESVIKEFIKKELIEGVNKETISKDGDYLILERKDVIDTQCIEAYLPYVVTIRTRKYRFLRSYTISILLNLFEDDKVVMEEYKTLYKQVKNYYIGLSSLYKFFYNEEGQLKQENHFDYNTVCSLFRNIDIRPVERYSAAYLRSFIGIDDMEQALADGIVEASSSNKEFIKKFDSSFSFIPSKYT